MLFHQVRDKGLTDRPFQQTWRQKFWFINAEIDYNKRKEKAEKEATEKAEREAKRKYNIRGY